MKKVPVIYTLMILVLGGSCVKDNFDFDLYSDKISYRPSVVIPIAHGSLTLGNLIESYDTDFIFDSDNSIRLLIRQDTILTFTNENIFKVPIPEPVSGQIPLAPVGLDPISSSSGISLGDLVAPGRMGDPEASLINGSAGSISLFPAVTEQNIGSFPADPVGDFEFARFTGGEIILSVTNNFPVEVSMDIILINGPDGSQVGVFKFGKVGPGQTVLRAAPLSGIMVHNEMSFEVTGFSSPGSGTEQVLIKLDDELLIGITSENLLAEMGRARVPLTVIGTGRDFLDMHFEADQRIDELNLESGTVHYRVDNSSGGVMLNVEMVNVIASDDPFDFDIITDGSGGMAEGEEYFSDAGIELSVYQGRLLVNYTLMTGSDEGLTDFDLTPGVLGFNIGFSDFKTGYATGYFGAMGIITGKQIFIEYDLFDRLAGDFRFINPSIRFLYENSLGVPFRLRFDLEGESSGGREQVNLPEEGHFGIEIGSAEGPFSNTSGELLLGGDVAGVVEFVSLPPSDFMFESFTIMNPQGDTGPPNFITSGSRLNVDMEIDLPLEIQMTNMVLTDTIGIDIVTDNIESLFLDMDAENGFPLGLSVDLSLYDSVRNVVLHTFEDIVRMKAATVQENGFVVPGSATTAAASIEISGSTADLLGQAGHMIITARIDAGEHDSRQVPLKFQTTNSFDFRIKIRANLNINN